MKNKEIVLYDDTNDYEKYDETRHYLFAEYGEEENWACKENIPDERVYEQISQENEESWLDLKYALEKSFHTLLHNDRNLR